MADMPAPHEWFDRNALTRLACPACYGNLRLQGARVICATCHRAYPIVDGIPVLIVERAQTAGEESWK